MKNILQCIIIFILFTAATSAFAQFSYINPMPGSKMKNKETSIILKNGGLIEPVSLMNNLISIQGSKSGIHTNRIVLSDDKKTICVYPQPLFMDDETVYVKVKDGFRRKDGTIIRGTSFQFETHPANPRIVKAENEDLRLNCNNLVPYTISINNNPWEGDIFYYNFWSSSPLCWARTIINNAGDSIYSEFNNSEGLDFKINHNGYLTYYDVDNQVWHMADSSYNVVKTFEMGNGYAADEHEFLVFPDGFSFMMALDTAFYQDLTVIGGHDSVNVIGNVLQQLDPSGNVIFEWSSFDHYEYEDAMFWVLSTGMSLGTNGWWDWYHANSIELENDSAIIISSRHYSEIAKISLNTGEFIWQWGGKNNQFHFVNDDSDRFIHSLTQDTFYFSGQHDVRRLPNGNITFFNNDNNLGPAELLRSDAKEYELDEVNKIATLKWHYYHPLVSGYVLQSLAMGSVQRLPNGNTFINWGLIGLPQHYDIMPKMTEVDSLGNIAWEFNWPFDGTNFYATYRAHKFIWERCNLLVDSALLEDSFGVNAALLSWNSNSKFSGYILEYKKCNDSAWISVTLNTNFYDLQGLESSTCYNWRLQSICSIYDDTSDYTATQVFLTDVADQTAFLVNPVSSFELYPNPATGEAEIRFITYANHQVQLTIYNLIGGIMKYEIISAQPGINRFKIDLGKLAAGAYHVELKAGSQTLRHRLVVN